MRKSCRKRRPVVEHVQWSAGTLLDRPLKGAFAMPALQHGALERREIQVSRNCRITCHSSTPRVPMPRPLNTSHDSSGGRRPRTPPRLPQKEKGHRPVRVMALWMLVCSRSRLHHPSSADTNAGANNANQRNYPGEGVMVESHRSL